MRILVAGGSGMLGHKVFQVLNSRFDVYATFREAYRSWGQHPLFAAARADHLLSGVDATDWDSVVRALAQVRPDAVVNCIGIVKQLPEAGDPLLSLSINALFPHRLAYLCAASGARLLHISTDCVFSGRKGNYTESDVPDAEDLYGRTKLLGEVSRPGCLTIRTSIIGRDLKKQSALLEWFLSHRGGHVRGYRNSLYSGLTTLAMAHIIGDILTDYPHLSGLYQVSSSPISKYDLLVKIRAAMQLDIEIEPHDDPPCNRSLSAARFIAATGDRIPSWDEMVAGLASDSTPYDEWRERYAAPGK